MPERAVEMPDHPERVLQGTNLSGEAVRQCTICQDIVTTDNYDVISPHEDIRRSLAEEPHSRVETGKRQTLYQVRGPVGE